ncbi:MAG: hypothetical protein AVO35_09480 [Candidatus Aegiribacteria sp. MLS_C]|nr:MAG: hypothetical protein AVO35_09480 [Candidatus Aegiribacteria sp. MLS_C]
MIEMLLATALLDTVIAVPGDGTVQVHEWGVVTFIEGSVVPGSDPATVSHWQTPFQQDPEQEMVVRAPVVYFYGPAFSGTFVVRAGSASFIETWPTPASMTDGPCATASWNIIGTSAREEGGTPGYPPGTGCIPEDLLELWREPLSKNLLFDDGGSESFIYYECSIDGGTGAWDPVRTSEDGFSLDPDYAGPVMSFARDGGSVVMVDPPEEEVIETLCDWAEGTMKTKELEGMWATWEEWIYGGSWQGDTLLIFPLPQSTVEGITGIELITDGMMEILYSRFFLGVLSV